MSQVTLEIARNIAKLRHDSPPVETGLLKQCPRCKRLGTVYVVEDDFMIVWDGPPRGGHGYELDADTTLSLGDLINPINGCGYDKESCS